MNFFSNILQGVSKFIFSSISQSNAIVANIENLAQTPAGEETVVVMETIAGGIVGPATVKAIEADFAEICLSLKLVTSVVGKSTNEIATEASNTMAEVKTVSKSAFTLMTTSLAMNIHKAILNQEGAPTEIPAHPLLVESVYRAEKQLLAAVPAATVAAPALVYQQQTQPTPLTPAQQQAFDQAPVAETV